ncbi:hypothetical protein HPB50_026760 [Hyalomma asiaticum]|uniref:Uncharacterized protein n=1 Tax=Hyalomma asiaticum TaxID=266040 RepID=A0ACB7S060_HYAAI|nr:hypothetical protein HPB50_026760 [Hyalomma asiaticum]
MGKKKRQRSSSVAQGVLEGATDHTAATADASSRHNRGGQTLRSPKDRSHSIPRAAAQPESVSAFISDGSLLSPTCGQGTSKTGLQKTTSSPGLPEDAPAGTTTATERSPLSPAVDNSAGVRNADHTDSRRQSTFSPLSPLDKRRPSTAGAATSASHHVANTMTPLDQVLVFGHGMFQWTVLICAQLAVFCTVVHAVAMRTLAQHVDHWCRPPAAYANLPPELWKNTSIPVEKDGSYSRCFRYEPPFGAYERGANLSSTIPCDAGWDYGTSIHSSIVSQWDLVCHRRWMMLLMTASYMGGTVVVMPFTGIAADRIGRAPVLVGALFGLIVAGTLLAFSTTLLMFTILRVFISTSSATLLVVSVVLLFEVTDSSRRVLYSSVAIAGGVSAANVYIDIMNDVANEWALIQMINMLPSVLLIGAVYFVQESPNWLLATHRFRRLSKVVMAAAQTNGADLTLVARRLEEIRQESRRSRSDSYTTEGVNEASPLEVVTNPSFRNETLVGFGCWFLAMILFDYLRSSREDQHLYYVEIVLECPAVTANIFLLERKGRRIATGASMIALGLLVAALGAFGFFYPDLSNADALLRHLETAVRVVALLAVDTVTVSLSIITVEMYPTVLRGSGLSFGYVCGRLGAITMTFASSGSRRGRGVGLAVVSLLLLVFGALALVVMPETTKIHATNLPPATNSQSKGKDKWKLDEPLRLARDRRSSSVADLRRKSMAGSLSRFPQH